MAGKLAKLAADPFQRLRPLLGRGRWFSWPRTERRFPLPRLVSWERDVEIESGTTPAAMLIQLDDHELVDDPCAHFTRSGFTAKSVGGGTAEIARRIPSTDDQDRREILLHLRVWAITNPDANVAIVG
jgi:hypothetical protein